MTKYISILIVAVLIASSVFAQNNTTNKEVRVISKYKSELPTAEKLNKVPVLVDTTRTNVKFSYSLSPRSEFANINLFSDDAPKLKGEPLKDLDGGYFRLGAGNYSTWMGEFAFNNKRSKKYDWGLYLYNYSSNGKVKVRSGDKQKTGLGNTKAHIYGKRFFENSVASVSLNYNVDRLRYYGYAETLDDKGAKQKFNDFKIDLSYSSKYDSEINYEARLSYSNFKDEFSDWKEDLIVAGLNIETEMLGNSFTADVSVEHLIQDVRHYESNPDYKQGYNIMEQLPHAKWGDYTCINLRPNYSIETGRFLIDLGLGISLKTGDNKDVYFYPFTTVKYAMVEDVISLYAFLKGGVKNNTLRMMSKENPFALHRYDAYYGEGGFTGSSHFGLLNGNNTIYTKYDIGAGLKGQFARSVSFNLSASYKQVEDFVFYTNAFKHGFTKQIINYSAFVPVYDNAKVFNIMAELDADIDDNINISTSFKYFNYSLETFEHPYHKPEAELNLKANYKYSSDLKFGASLMYVGERYGGENIKMDSYLLMGLDAEYEFTNYVYSFLKINNLFNTDYEKWHGYPNYGINLMIGMSFSF